MLSIKNNFKQISRELKQSATKVERATTMAINKVGFDVRQKLIDDMDKYIDRPTPFTKRAWILKQGRGKATVILKDIQASYLGWAIFGGTAHSTTRKLTTPTKRARLNRYGNVASKRTKGLVRGKKQFIATISGVTGVWQEVGTKSNPSVSLLHVIGNKKKYKKSYPVFKIAEKEIKKQYPIKLARAYEKVFG